MMIFQARNIQEKVNAVEVDIKSRKHVGLGVALLSPSMITS